MSSIISKRYAQALFESSVDQNVCEKVKDDLEQVVNLYESSPEFRNFIENPILEKNKKDSILESIFDKKVHKLTKQFLLFLNKKSRLDLIVFIVRDFQQIFCDVNNIVHVSVDSASKMTTHQISALKQHLKLRFRKEVVLNELIDESLIGGFKVRVGDQVMDYSLKFQIEEIRDNIIHSKN